LRGLEELNSSQSCWFVDSARVKTKWGQTPEDRAGKQLEALVCGR
jgi:hypothetical protein